MNIYALLLINFVAMSFVINEEVIVKSANFVPKAVSNVATDNFKVIKSTSVEINLNSSVKFEGLELLILDIIFEEIAGFDDTIPSGSGVSVHLQLSHSEITQEFVLNELSEPYDSKSFLIWKNYKVTLLEVVGYNKPGVKISIDLLGREEYI